LFVVKPQEISHKWRGGKGKGKERGHWNRQAERHKREDKSRGTA